jgi:hypothetical protein
LRVVQVHDQELESCDEASPSTKVINTPHKASYQSDISVPCSPGTVQEELSMVAESIYIDLPGTSGYGDDDAQGHSTNERMMYTTSSSYASAAAAASDSIATGANRPRSAADASLVHSATVSAALANSFTPDELEMQYRETAETTVYPRRDSDYEMDPE